MPIPAQGRGLGVRFTGARHARSLALYRALLWRPMRPATNARRALLYKTRQAGQMGVRSPMLPEKAAWRCQQQLGHEIHADLARDDALFGGATQEQADALLPALAQVQRPRVDVHAHKLIGGRGL